MDDQISTTELPRRTASLVGWPGALLVVTVACVLPAGCGAQPTLSSAQRAGSADLARQVSLALADASRRSGIGEAGIKVQSAEPVTWSDGSLGCPEGDLMYTQALVPGYRIRIAAGDQRLDYHADGRGQMLLCPPERSMDPLPARR